MIHIHLHDGFNGVTICREALKQLPEVKKLQLNNGGGYWYVTGETKEGRPIVTEGIYSYRIHHMTLESWVSSVVEVVKKDLP